MNQLLASPTLLSFLSAFSIIGLGATLWWAPRYIAGLPQDWLLRTPESPAHPVRAMLILTARNLIALVLLALGVTMLITPGPGVLMLLLGLGIARFPGRERLIHFALGHPQLLKLLDTLRARHGQPPFDRPERKAL